MDARVAAALLDKFGKLPNWIERPQPFMEIAGYPHYENVCSNFLHFRYRSRTTPAFTPNVSYMMTKTWSASLLSCRKNWAA